MRQMFRFLTRGWFLGLIGVIALCIIIWVGGPLLSLGTHSPLVSSFNRIVACAVVALLWILNLIRKKFMASRSNAQLIDNLVAAPIATNDIPTDMSAEEVEQLKERFDQALGRLKKSGVRNRFGKQALYDIPWYVIIGPPGTGKTTLLNNSGLEFPLSDQTSERKVQGIGGTRNCDWWFANEAILLDTAGRYTTQDSHSAADSGAWLGFLDLLKTNRPRRPLNGILIVASISDIQSDIEQQTDHHANAIRQRIQEIYDRLGIRLPIYFVITKCDLIAGFTEFFDDLSAEQRNQIWGITFPEKSDEQGADPLPFFASEFDGLIGRLNERLLRRMGQERDQSRRDRIYRFPQQVENIKPLVMDFIQSTFRSSQYDHPAWLRGVYLTSGTQEGSPIDRVMGGMARSFNLNIQAVQQYVGRAKAFFINRLLRDVIFREFGLAGTNRRYESARIWVQRGALAAAIVGTIGSLAALTYGYVSGESFLKNVQAGVDEYAIQETSFKEAPGQVDQLVTTLDAGRDLPDVYSADPPFMFLNVLQTTKLQDNTEHAYKRVLNEHLLGHVQGRLETRIKEAVADPGDLNEVFSTYDTLSTYSMLAEPDSFDPERFKIWVTDDWERAFPDQPGIREDLSSHLDRLLASGVDPRTLDASLLGQARQLVCRMPLPDQVYYRLYQLTNAAGIKSFSLANLGAVSQKYLKDARADGKLNQVEAFFTREAYDKIVKAEGTTVAGRAIRDMRAECPDQSEQLARLNQARIMRDVEERYTSEYVTAWESFLRNIQLLKFTDLQDAQTVLKAFAGGQSPLSNLVRSVVPNTNPNAKITSLIDKVLPNNEAAGPIASSFRTFNGLPVQPEGGVSPLDKLLTQIGELRVFVTEINESSDSAKAAFNAAISRLSSDKIDAFRTLRRQSGSLPKPVGTVSSELAINTWGAVLRHAHKHINNAWQAEVLEPYQGSIDGRYPMVATASSEIPFADFGKFFGEAGTLEKFKDKYLKPFVNTTNGKPVTIDGQKINFDADAIAGLQRSTHIRESFFQDGGQKPKVNFSIKSEFLDRQALSMLFDLDGQVLNYRQGPHREMTMEWPGPKGLGETRVVLEHKSRSSETITQPGPWAWFKLLDRAAVDRTTSKDVIIVTFVGTNTLEGRYQIRASSVINPFHRNELLGFKLPKSL